MSYGKAAKLPSFQENPVDRIFIAASDAVCPQMKAIGATPNMITTACVIASLFAVRAVYIGDKNGFVLWTVFAYFLDCLDGHFARRYNMCTVFGDYYDHITDWLYYGLLFLAAFYIRGFKSAYEPYALIIYALIALATAGMFFHFGCQETVFSAQSRMTNAESPTLGIFRHLFSYSDPMRTIQLSKFFGSGTYTVLIIALIVITIK